MFVVLVLCVLGFIYIYWQRKLYKNAPPPIYGTWIKTFLYCTYYLLRNEDIWNIVQTIQDDTKKAGGIAYFLIGFKRVYGKKLLAELRRMEELNVVRKVTHPTDWVNAIVLVPKTDSSIRVYVWSRDLSNRAVRRAHYSLPTMPGLSVLDTRRLLAGGARRRHDLCTLSTPFVRYQFLRLPNEINCAPEVFDANLRQHLEDLEGVESFIDDVIIWGRTQEEHDRRLKYLLKRALGVVITKIDDLNTVIAKCNSKGFTYDNLRHWLGEGILLAEPNNHKSRRKMLQPSFNPRLVNTFAPTINALTANWIPQLKSLANGEPLDFAQHILKFNCNVFNATFYGVSGVNYNCDAYLSAVEELQKLTILKFITPIYHIDFFFNWSQHKEIQKSMKVVRNTTEEIIKERKSILEKQAKENNNAIHSENKIFLDILLELKDKGHYTDAQYLDEPVNIIFAGTDTSSYTTLYTLLLLGSHSDVQEKVYQELKNVFPEKIPENLDREDLEKLVYLDAVLKEAMRLFPYVPMLSRFHDQDIQLKNYTIPKDSECALMLYAAQRDVTWCEDPETFCPERWLGADSDGLNRKLLTFGAGPYVCMGKYYALMAMKITLTHLLSAYRFRADWTQLKLKYEVTLLPKSGHHISMERRI